MTKRKGKRAWIMEYLTQVRTDTLPGMKAHKFPIVLTLTRIVNGRVVFPAGSRV